MDEILHELDAAAQPLGDRPDQTTKMMIPDDVAERRALQQKYGLYAANENEEYEEGEMNMAENMQVETQEKLEKKAAKQSLAQSLEDEVQTLISVLRPSLADTAKHTAVKAAVWAPVVFGVGFALLRLTKTVTVGEVADVAID